MILMIFSNNTFIFLRLQKYLRTNTRTDRRTDGQPLSYRRHSSIVSRFLSTAFFLISQATGSPFSSPSWPISTEHRSWGSRWGFPCSVEDGLHLLLHHFLVRLNSLLPHFVCLFVYPCVYLSICLSLCLFIYLSVCLSVCFWAAAP